MISLRSTLGRRLLTTTRVVAQEPKAKNFLFDGISEMNKVNQTLKANASKTPILPGLVKRFNKGETYDPFDFSIAKLNLEKKQAKADRANQVGLFDKKRLNPLDFYTNSEFLSQYVTSTGRLQSRDVTKLTVKNQKRLSKAVKRARAVGFMSSVHRNLSLFKSN